MSETLHSHPKLEIVLNLVLEGVLNFENSLAAIDRGETGDECQSEGNSVIRIAFQRAPELNDLLPRLAARLETGHSLADYAFDIRDEVEAVRKMIRKDEADKSRTYNWISY
jgi:hypothetical protein